MEQEVKLCMTKQDAEEIQKIFNERHDPCFTILKMENDPIEEDVVHVEMFVDSMSTLWYLARTVQLYADHRQRIAKLIEDTLKSSI